MADDDPNDRFTYSGDQPLEVVSVGEKPAPEPEVEVEEMDEGDVPEEGVTVVNIYETPSDEGDE